MNIETISRPSIADIELTRLVDQTTLVSVDLVPEDDALENSRTGSYEAYASAVEAAMQAEWFMGVEDAGVTPEEIFDAMTDRIDPTDFVIRWGRANGLCG